MPSGRARGSGPRPPRGRPARPCPARAPPRPQDRPGPPGWPRAAASSSSGVGARSAWWAAPPSASSAASVLSSGCVGSATVHLRLARPARTRGSSRANPRAGRPAAASVRATQTWWPGTGPSSAAVPRLSWTQVVPPSRRARSTRTSNPRWVTRSTVARWPPGHGSRWRTRSWGRTGSPPSSVAGPRNRRTNSLAGRS